MDERRSFAALEAAIRALCDRLRAGGGFRPSALDGLFLEEIRGSAALSGAALDRGEVEALLAGGVALGGRPLGAYIAVADYADAVRYLRAAPLPGRRSPYVLVEEVVELHARALRRSPAARPGTWRAAAVERLTGGVVPPPPWLIPREIAAFVARVAFGPPEGASKLLWVAQAHERFHRIHPFTAGNGRTGRLVTNLLLRRLDLPPFAVRSRDALRYLAALQRADSRDPWPLALVLARSVLAGATRLVAAHEERDDLCAISSFAAGAERAALYKAAQRGRLRVVRRNGSLLTTAAWLTEYRASRRRIGPQ
jgi:Fic family protein